MPITGDAAKVKKSMTDQYGKEKGERVFYATANKQDREPETWKKKAASTPASIVRHYLLRSLGQKVARSLDTLPGGLGDGMPDSAFNPEQLEEGIEVEMEHTSNPVLAKEIAKDHLAEEEAPPEEQEYYDELDDMESELEMKKAAYLQTLGLKVAAAMGLQDAASGAPAAPQPPGGAAGQDMALAPQPGPVSAIPGVEPPKQIVPQSQVPSGAPAPAGGTAAAAPAGGRPSTGTPNPATGAQPAPPVTPKTQPPGAALGA